MKHTIKIQAVMMTFLATGMASAQPVRSIFPLLPPTVSTVPSNGDVNPYGVAFVPKTVPTDSVLQPGDVLVSNFNNNQNLQGTGTTIIRVDNTGKVTTFYTSPQAQGGLTAALGILSNGIVLIGNLPTADGTSATVQAGRLTLLNRAGTVVAALANTALINGPWGMAIHDTGNGVSGVANVFLSNVLSGVISRIDITYSATGLSLNTVVLASGFNHRLDPAALVLGPSGLAYDAIHDTLYVASSADNSISTIAHAATATATETATLLFNDFTHLHGPLDIVFLPNGHMIVANSDGSNVDPNQPSELVEYTAAGQFVAQMPVDPNNGGAFGVGVNSIGWGTFQMAFVDDNANTLRIVMTAAR